jgi:thiomorpholine-carboxylate dehydrogenase
MSLPYFSESDVRGLLSYEALIPAIRQALIDLTAGRVQQPLRQILEVPLEEGKTGWFATMPVVAGDVMGVKTVTFYPTNAAHGLHTHMAVIELLSRTTGEPLALMDGRLITEMRTAAVSAVAFAALKPADATTFGIIGSGVQARSHVHALVLLWPELKEIRISGRKAENAARLAAELVAEYPGIQIHATEIEAAAAADVLLVATSSPTPVLEARWLPAQSLILTVGATGKTVREIDAATMLSSTVIADSRASVERESGDVILSGATVHCEIGEILLGEIAAPQNQRVLFKSVGLAIEDLVAADLVWKAANK